MRAKMLVVLAMTAPACSDPEVAPFPELDRDQNGRISAEEAADDVRLARDFSRADADRNGELTALEYLQVATR
jgi:EF hand